MVFDGVETWKRRYTEGYDESQEVVVHDLFTAQVRKRKQVAQSRLGSSVTRRQAGRRWRGGGGGRKLLFPVPSMPALTHTTQRGTRNTMAVGPTHQCTRLTVSCVR